jgi:hypothetical protein
MNLSPKSIEKIQYLNIDLVTTTIKTATTTTTATTSSHFPQKANLTWKKDVKNRSGS